jgi:MFS family permease
MFSAVTGLAVASGPLVGGAVAQGINWHWICWVNVPIALVSIPLVLTKMKESHGQDTGLDLRGLALVTGCAWRSNRSRSSGAWMPSRGSICPSASWHEGRPDGLGCGPKLARAVAHVLNACLAGAMRAAEHLPVGFVTVPDDPAAAVVAARR